MIEGKQILGMKQITKRFGDLVALSDTEISLRAGEVHAVVGENGAGKSTLMRILAGHMFADEGSMSLHGLPVDISKNASGQRSTVGFVEQEGGLIAELTGVENLILAERKSFWCNRGRARMQLKELADKFGATIDPDVPVNTLSMGQRQRLEIFITLARGAEILILDEPTAALSLDDAKVLGDIIRRFVEARGAVFYISHKLAEVTEIADRITVMRRGKVVGRHGAKEASVAQLAREMVGEINGHRQSQNGKASSEDTHDFMDLALSVRGEVHYEGPAREVCFLNDVTCPSSYQSEASLKQVSLTVGAGEVVGIAGVVGNGQTTLAEVLAGITQPSSGQVTRSDGPVGYVPENRHRDALALPLSIQDNLVVHMHRRKEFTSGLWMRGNAIDSKIESTLKESRVYGAAKNGAASSLSGGNQQKLVLGRELEQGPILLVAHNPFRGLDVRAIQDVRDAINGACKAGCGVVMISSDLDELFQLAHRIVVMFDGRIVGDVNLANEGTDVIGKLMGGVARDLVH